MKKAIAAAAVGALLVAGQAAAAQNNASARVGDRIGANTAEASEFAGVPLPVLLVGAALIVTAVVVASDDDGESD